MYALMDTWMLLESHRRLIDDTFMWANNVGH